MTTTETETLGDKYPMEQERLRGLLVDAHALAKLPGVNMAFYIAGLNATLAEADAAAMSGDPVRMLRAYKTMHEVER